MNWTEWSINRGKIVHKGKKDNSRSIALIGQLYLFPRDMDSLHDGEYALEK